MPQLDSVDGKRSAAHDGAVRSNRTDRSLRPFELLAAKTAVPTVRQGTVMRPGLVNRLRAAADRRVVTVVAPAGYGKTTLLAQWAQRDGRPFAWVSLDEGDDAPSVIRYLASALDQIESIDMAGDAIRSTGVARLSSAFSRVSQPIVVVFDDVHVACSHAAAAVLATLVRHVPEGSTLALAGRSLPELPIARLRAEGVLFELGTAELTFSRREAHLLLRAVHAGLDAADAEELRDRTEGWAAGLHLAGLVLDDGHSLGSCVSEFTGDDRFVADYFRLEHLSMLDPSDLRFLTRSSVLESMCGPLCDAVVGEARDSAQKLESLEQSSLFVVPLDRHRVWYRYHRLFRETLRAELERREPDLVPMLNRRAAVWCEANGELDAARRYAAAAGDMNAAARLVATHALSASAEGRVRDLDSWLEGLGDPSLLERHPTAAVVGSWIHALAGRADEAAIWFRSAEHAAADASSRNRTTSTAALLTLLRAAFCRDGADRMLHDAEAALEGIAWTNRWRPMALFVCGVAHVLRDEVDSADARFAEAEEAAAAFGANDIRRIALAERSLLATAAGNRSLGRDLAHAARCLVGEQGLRAHATSALELAAIAQSALRTGDWQEARAALEEAQRLLHTLTHALPWCSVQASLELARAHLALLDTTGAVTLLSRAEAILQQRPDLGVLDSQAQTLRAELSALLEQDARWVSTLTPAELRLLPLLCTRLSFREIGERLHVSRNTVKTQAISVYRKLGVSSRNDAIDRATELGLLDAPAHD